jgi:hypothetical protein
MFHDHETAGHSGELETYIAVSALLVAWNMILCQELRQRLWNLPTVQKLTETHLTPLIYLQKGLDALDLSQKSQWIQSRTSH